MEGGLFVDALICLVVEVCEITNYYPIHNFSRVYKISMPNCRTRQRE